jgi:Polyprenyl synthetase
MTLCTLVNERFDTDLPTEFAQALQIMVTHDDAQQTRSLWGSIIPTIQRILGDETNSARPFAGAWSLLYMALGRLDCLQDGDPLDIPLPTINQINAQYNLVLSYYVLAESLLDQLSPDLIPVYRILRLRRLWTDMMLRMGAGQQRDLLSHNSRTEHNPLEYYQEIAQSKTGAAYALAIGGTATLLTDDDKLIDTFTVVGEIYGTLLQYSDDVIDAETQKNETITFPAAFHSAAAPSNEHTPQLFWRYVYHAYHEQLALEIANLAVEQQEAIFQLFVRTFDSD